MDLGWKAVQFRTKQPETRTTIVESLSSNRRLRSTIVSTIVKPVLSISSHLSDQRRPRDPWMNQEDTYDHSSIAEDNYRAVVARGKRLDIEVD